jgi:phosphatidylglycerophosphatase C
MQLVLFDFDGTITRKNSLPAFLRYALGDIGLLKTFPRVAWRWGCLLFQRRWSAAAAKSALLGVCLGGRTRRELEQLGAAFIRDCPGDFWNPAAIERIALYRQMGATLAIVSASLDFWVQPFAQQWDMVVLCTMARYDNGVFQGNFEGENCKGTEKVHRIQARFQSEMYLVTIAYGNSKGDTAMLEWAQNAWYCQRDGHFLQIK